MRTSLKQLEQMRSKGRFLIDQPFTPDVLLHEITSHIPFDADASVLVLFTIEWALWTTILHSGKGSEWQLHLLTLQRVSNILTLSVLTHFKYKL